MPNLGVPSLAQIIENDMSEKLPTKWTKSSDSHQAVWIVTYDYLLDYSAYDDRK